MLNEHFLIINNIRTRVAITGTGKPLLLVHGLGGPQMWDRVIEPLAKHFQVIVVDLPGFGESHCPAHGFTTEEYADVLKLLLDELKIPRAAIAGISYGGQIAATFAHEFPDRVERLVLIVSTGLAAQVWITRIDIVWKVFSLMVKHTVLRSRLLLGLFSRRSFYDIGNRPSYFVEKFYRQLSPPCKRDSWLNGLRNVYTAGNNFRNLISAISNPTLIIWGKEDVAVPLTHAYEFQRLMRNAELKIFPECAHSVPLEKSGELREVIEKLVSTPYPS